MASRAPKPPLPIESSLFYKLVRVANLASRLFVTTPSTRYRLTLNEWRAMVVLTSHPGIAARDVALHTGLDKMSVSRALAGLEREGRLVRAPEPADARRMQLRLSEAGRALFETLGVHAMKRERQLFAALDADEQRRLMRSVDKLIAGLSRAEPSSGADPKSDSIPHSDAE